MDSTTIIVCSRSNHADERYYLSVGTWRTGLQRLSLSPRARCRQEQRKVVVVQPSTSHRETTILLNAGACPQRRTVAAQLTISRERENSGRDILSTLKEPALARAPSASTATRTKDAVLGMAGIIVVAVILGLSIYCVARYLL
jgi:hypothetical protein